MRYIKKKPVYVLMLLVIFFTTYSLIVPAASMTRQEAEEDPGITLNEYSETDSEEENSEPEKITQKETISEETKDPEKLDETADVQEPEDPVDEEQETAVTEEETEPSPVLTYPAVTFEETIENFVTVKAAAEEGTFPEGTTMILTPVEQEEVIDTVKETVEGTVKHIVAVDITFKDVNGNEIEPLKQINVTMSAPSIKEETETEVVHIDNEGNGTLVDQEESAEDEVIFNTDSFSVYIIAYTVDFHYEVNGKEYETSIDGGSVVSLAELLPSLHVIDTEKAEEFVGNIRIVTFTDETLVRPVYIEEDVTVEELFRRLNITPEYSSEYTEEEINTILSKELHTGEWVLISLKPFTTEETMTVTMKDDEVFTVKVTDAQISTHVLTADGRTYKITVTYDDDAMIPDGTKLAAREIQPGTKEYMEHLEKAWTEVNKDYLEQEERLNSNIEDYDEYEDIRPVNLDDARFFEVDLLYNGNRIEPEAPVHVEISYVDGFDTDAEEENLVTGVAHYKGNTVELIADVETEKNDKGEITEFIYEQDSFSDIGTYVGQKTFDNVPLKINPALAMPRLYALSRAARNSGELRDIEAHKHLEDNHDGTYTLSLTVKGDAVVKEEYNKSNILFVMDRSSSMDKNYVYQPYDGPHQNGITYYGSDNGGKTGYALSYDWRSDKYYYSGREYTGQLYTRVKRLVAEQACMDALVQNLLAKNDPNKPGKEDLIEISVISFADRRQSGNTEYTNWTSSDYTGLMRAINNDNAPSGTNWEDALIYAKEVADAKKRQQPDEDVYVIFLTDGEPTAIAGESGGAKHYISDSDGRTVAGGFEYALTENPDLVGGASYGTQDNENALDRAKEIVDDGFKLYGIFTFNPGEAQTKYLRRLMNFAYTGVDKAYENDATKEDTDIVKKYFTNADTPETLTQAFEKIFADISSVLGHGNVVLEDGLESPDAMTTTIHADKADGFRYSVTDDLTDEELYYVTATGSNTAPTVTFHIDGHEYSGVEKEGTDGKTYYSATVGGTEYKMALADLNGRELTWDLTAMGFLMPDCTYKAEMIVWPNQAAYDYVAGLNNGLPGYTWNPSVESNPENSYTVTVDGVTYEYYTGGVATYPSIVKNKETGVYSVLTNTHQELNYSIVNEKTNEVTGEKETNSVPQDPVPLEIQKPMDLVDTNSSIEKKWNIDLNPGIFAELLYPSDGSHYTLIFDVYRGTETVPYMTMNLGWDGTKYVWEADSETEVEYNDQPYIVGTTWKKAFSIPTGLMLSEERMDELHMDKTAYPSGTFTDGKTYYLLEEGHDFTIKERNLGYEFDFNSDVFHPMLVDGKMQNVIFTKTGDKTIAISKMTTEKNGLPSLKVENTLRGYIHLEKIVTDSKGQTVETDKNKFEYTITLENEKDLFEGTHIPWYGINDLFYHDKDFNYYQVYKYQGKLKLKNEAGEIFDVIGSFNVDEASEQTLTYSTEDGPKELKLFGNQTTPSDQNKKAEAVLYISQGEKLSIANVPDGTVYTITESQKAGYQLADITHWIDPDDIRTPSGVTTVTLAERKITGTIEPNHHTYVTYKNRSLTADITIEKKDEHGKGLAGAVFELVKVGADGHSEVPASDIDTVQGLSSFTKTIDGNERHFAGAFETDGKIQKISGLPDGTYRLYERVIPEGFVSTFGYIQFKVEDCAIKDVTTDTGDTAKLNFTARNGSHFALLQVTNTLGIELPHTGGQGTRLFYLCGILMILFAGSLLTVRKSRK